MTKKYDAIIIGGGHNGLVCAFYLARAGLKVRVLERRDIVGGAAVTEEFHPGFRNSTASYTVSLLRPKVIKDMRLHERGWRIIERTISNFFPHENGYLKLGGGEDRTRAEFARYSQKDADTFPKYEEALERVADVLRDLSLKTPPNAGGGLRALIAAAVQGKKLAGMHIEAQRDVMDLFVKSARDFLDGWYETEYIKAAFGFDAVVGNYASPDTPGSAYVLLHHVFGEINGKKGMWGHSVGGMGAITQYMAEACEEAGVEISLEAPVARVLVDGGKVAGVVLESGEEIAASIVASNAGPALLFRQLVDRADLPAEFAHRMDRFKAGSGTFRMNVALSELPDFTVLPGKEKAEHHTCGIIISPTLDYMDQAFTDAKAFGWSKKPIVEMKLPTSVDDSLGAAGNAHRQPVLPAICAGPAQWPVMGRRARGGGRPDHRHGQRARPQFQGVDHRAADPLAARSRAQVRADRRRHHAWQHVARSALGGAPGAWPRRLPQPDQGSLYVRRGHASGRRGDRRAGAQCRARDIA